MTDLIWSVGKWVLLALVAWLLVGGLGAVSEIWSVGRHRRDRVKREEQARLERRLRELERWEAEQEHRAYLEEIAQSERDHPRYPSWLEKERRAKQKEDLDRVVRDWRKRKGSNEA